MLLRLLNPYIFAAPGAVWENAGSGKFVKLISATAAVDVELWQRGQMIGELKGLTQGQGARVEDDDDRPIRFDQCKITSSAAQSVVVAVGDGKVETDALTGSVVATIVKGATLLVSSATAGAASSTVLEAAATRRKVVMKNTHATDTAYWCEDATAATTGKYPIGPGEEQQIESTDGINAIRGGANDVTLAFFEERD